MGGKRAGAGRVGDTSFPSSGARGFPGKTERRRGKSWTDPVWVQLVSGIQMQEQSKANSNDSSSSAHTRMVRVPCARQPALLVGRVLSQTLKTHGPLVLWHPDSGNRRLQLFIYPVRNPDASLWGSERRDGWH